ncbi:MAG: EamA family transporter [Erysipelotrichaceae bacterium]
MVGVESNLGTAIRTSVVLVMAWGIVFGTKKHHAIVNVSARDYLFLCLSGLATGASWLCFYRALQLGPASLIVPIDKLSIVFAVGFGYFCFGERLSKKATIGLALLVLGTLVMLL